MNKHNELINRAQLDLDNFGQISRNEAQALIDALIAATGGDKVFVCNEEPDFEAAQAFADSLSK